MGERGESRPNVEVEPQPYDSDPPYSQTVSETVKDLGRVAVSGAVGDSKSDSSSKWW